MDLSRRRMLQGVVAMTVVTATPMRWVAGAQAAPAEPVRTSGGAPWFSRASYRDLVGTRFYVGAVVLTLTAIGDLTPQPGRTKGIDSDGRFSLLFTSGSVVGPGIRTFVHAALGSCPLFLAPVGPPARLRTYEVIVNRLV